MNSTYTITFSECAENHIGNQKVGRIAKDGFTCDELKTIMRKLEKEGVRCRLVDLGDLIDDHEHNAMVLIIWDGANHFLKNNNGTRMLLSEQRDLSYDTKYYDIRRQKLLNKRARHNICFSDHTQEANYEEGKGTIVAFTDIPFLNALKDSLHGYLGEKASELNAEGNYYYDNNKCYIGFHGDTERKRVIGLRLGATTSLYYQWYQNSKPIGRLCEIILDSGDMYIMSEKATGNDWLTRSKLTIRHAAGNDKTLKLSGR